MFINYYLKNATKKFSTDNIFNLNSLFEELILDSKFNKILEDISKSIWEELWIKKLNNLIQYDLNSTLGNLSELLIKGQDKIINKLNHTETSEIYEDMLPLSYKIDNYAVLVDEQNNRFKFIVSNLSLKMFNIFSKDYLEPPLNQIKK